MNDSALEQIHRSGWPLPEAVWRCMSDGERAFATAELSGIRTPGYYAARLRRLGLSECGRVLDAGCGIGQWSIALAGVNESVAGVDINTGRLMIARELAGAMAAENTGFEASGLESLPFEDSFFDAAFCYGVLMFTDIARSLGELHRVVRPGGIVYVNANAPAWYPVLLRDPARRLAALRMIARTVAGRPSNRVVTAKWLEKVTDEAGFDVVAIGAEGETTVRDNEEAVPPAYPRGAFGAPLVIELVARTGSA